MNRIVTIALIGCAGLSALGGFGEPVLCHGQKPECGDKWRAAASGALTVASFLGTLLAPSPGGPNP